MTIGKRIFDILLGLWLVIWLGPAIIVISIMILLKDGRPIFYPAERMKSPNRSFTLWKFRTMRQAADDGGVSGGDKAARITIFGAKLRRKRLDELPQLWNILKGDVSFVGPRPPLRRYTERYPETYARVLRSRPGVTGLATLHMHGYEERVLASSKDSTETDQVYARRCIPLKARLDLVYQANQSVCYDALLIWQTMKRVFGRSRGL